MPKNELELSPLRSLDDFLLGSARFQLPNYRDLEKWGNRVVQNLLYYQTNYFIMSICMLLVFTFLHPLKMLLGAFSVFIMYGLFYFSVNASSAATRFKKNHPFVGVVLIITGACLVVYLLGSFVVFLCGILSPISAIFIHASLRLRNIKNKLSSIERVVSSKTPMGVLLESLGACYQTQTDKFGSVHCCTEETMQLFICSSIIVICSDVKPETLAVNITFGCFVVWVVIIQFISAVFAIGLCFWRSTMLLNSFFSIVSQNLPFVCPLSCLLLFHMFIVEQCFSTFFIWSLGIIIKVFYGPKKAIYE